MYPSALYSCLLTRFLLGVGLLLILLCIHMSSQYNNVTEYCCFCYEKVIYVSAKTYHDENCTFADLMLLWNFPRFFSSFMLTVLWKWQELKQKVRFLYVIICHSKMIARRYYRSHGYIVLWGSSLSLYAHAIAVKCWCPLCGTNYNLT